MKLKAVVSGFGVAALVGTRCASDSSEIVLEQQQSVTDPGGLVQMDMNSQVGVLLDELPVGPVREAAAANAVAKATSFWQDRAIRQARLMDYRLVFRAQYYNSYWSN